jgi:putative cell wall-binding protein
MRRYLILLTYFALGLAAPATSLAADAATIVFRSGQVVRLNDGFKDIAPALERLNENSQDHKIVQLTLSGNTFLLNLAEVVILCRDDCRGLTVEDKRDPARQKR